jgi:hypothetical protein
MPVATRQEFLLTRYVNLTYISAGSFSHLRDEKGRKYGLCRSILFADLII